MTKNDAIDVMLLWFDTNIISEDEENLLYLRTEFEKLLDSLLDYVLLTQFDLYKNIFEAEFTKKLTEDMTEVKT